MSIRLSISNSETAKRTRDLYKPVQHVSMSCDEKRSNLKQSASSKAYNERVEYFNMKGKR